jgi:hypothetical protein
MEFPGRSGKTSSMAIDARGRASRQMAIDSFRNIARLKIGPTESADTDVEAILAALTSASGPIAIVDLAHRLAWDADRLSEALARGTDRGDLVLTKSGGRTFAELPAPPSA